MKTFRLNTKIKAPSEYSDFSHTSFVDFGGVLLGAGPNGLFQLNTGCYDDGEQIDAYFIPATTTFDSSGKKRAMAAFFVFECSSAMKISLTGDGKTTIGPFTVNANATEGPQRRRAVFGKGLKWVQGKFKIENDNGSKFSIDKIEIQLGSIPISGK